MMGDQSNTNSPLIYFLSGALLPSLALLLLQNQKSKQRPVGKNALGNKQDDAESDDGHDYDDDSSAGPESDGEISKTWGMKDAPYKMVLCVNTSLGMKKGKIAAQCCHAAVGCYKKANIVCPNGLAAWERTGCAKIAVKCPSDDEMMNEILIKAMQAGIPTCFIEDAGRTQIAAGSRTVLGLGPAPTYAFEGITSHLKLM
jgi:PTH2 family peptidyl-tRNA hydrolase